MCLRVGSAGAESEDFELLLAVEAERVFLVSGLGNDTGLVIVRTRKIEIAVLCTTSNTHCSIKSAGILEEIAHVVIPRAGIFFAPGIIGEIVKRGSDVFLLSIVLVFHEASAILVLYGRKGGFLHPVINILGTYIHLNRALFTLLGGDEDNAVCSTGTIQGRCGRAF